MTSGHLRAGFLELLAKTDVARARDMIGRGFELTYSEDEIWLRILTSEASWGKKARPVEEVERVERDEEGEAEKAVRFELWREEVGKLLLPPDGPRETHQYEQFARVWQEVFDTVLPDEENFNGRLLAGVRNSRSGHVRARKYTKKQDHRASFSINKYGPEGALQRANQSRLAWDLDYLIQKVPADPIPQTTRATQTPHPTCQVDTD